jgi:bacillolysin
MKSLPPLLVLAMLATATVGAQTPRAQQAQVARDQLGRLLNSLAPVSPTPAAAATEVQVLLSATPEGHLTHLGAPSGYAFSPGVPKSGDPVKTARAILLENTTLLGASAPAVDFITTRTSSRQGRHYIRLQQAYAGVPVVAGEVVVQLNAQEDLEAILADVARANLAALEEGRLSPMPHLNATLAAELARTHLADRAAPHPVETTAPKLAIFAPEVLDELGEPRLVYDFMASCADPEKLDHRVLLDAHSGELVRVWQVSCHALNRRIYDGQNTTGVNVLERDEGDAASGIAQVDRCYTHISETWNFYNNNHGRDSYDDAGARIEATVRFCSVSCGCPCVNAFSGNASSVTSRMVFGNGYVTDDVVAHEFTHRVTQLTSGLIYTNASGAINESLSDVWGEFVDLTYDSQGDDSAGVRWLVSEDRTAGSGGAIRNMANPPNFSDPDRLNSSLYQAPSNTSDNGGVHRNSGVNNKLAYLLVDGDTFNGQTVSPTSMASVVDLYYEAQVDLLTSGSSYTSLGNALRQAAVNLGWSQDSQNNVYRACLAVEIVGSASNYYVDKITACTSPVGFQSCIITFGPWKTVAQGVTGIPAGNTLNVRGDNYNEPQTIRKAMTIRGYNGTVNLGLP